MLKKMISAVLALTLVFGAACVNEGNRAPALNVMSASAAEDLPQAYDISIAGLDWELMSLDGETITKSTYADKAVLFVFYRATMIGEMGMCFNSNSMISRLAASDWIKAEGVQVIAVDVDGNTGGDVQRYRETYAPGCNDIVFTYGATGSGLSWNFRSLCGESGGYTLTYCVIVNDDTICYAWDKGTSADLCRDALSQVADLSVPVAFPKGDVNGDGVVNINDINELAAHIKGVQKLADTSRADVTGDGKIDPSDLAAIAAHVKGVSKLS